MSNITANTTHSHKQTVRRFYEEALNQNRPEIVEQIVAEGFFDHWSGAKGPKELLVNSQRIAAAFPDRQFAVEDLIEEGDRVVIRWTMRGTHQGPFHGRPPTGKPIEQTAISIFRIEDGKIAEQWLQLDTARLFRQLEADA